MTRITKIDLNHFRAFYGQHTIDLTGNFRDPATGQRRTVIKNLLVYGENGSGKSSLRLALDLILASSPEQLPFTNYRNIFAQPNTDGHTNGHIKITLSNNDGTGESTHTWSETQFDTAAYVIKEANKTKGILSYRNLFEVYFDQPKDGKINIFDLLLTKILANFVNRITNQTLGAEWQSLCAKIPQNRGHVRVIEKFQDELNQFTDQIKLCLQELESKASDILREFTETVAIQLQFDGLTYNSVQKQINGQNIALSVKLLNQDINSPHQLLNEAKLSAIALSLYLASLLVSPSSSLKILVLDDILIGLDMSNRIPFIKVIQNYFIPEDYQIFMLTYDKAWYNIARQALGHQSPDWLYLEFFYGLFDGFEVPVINEGQGYLEKAERFFGQHDYKASAIYLRTELEVILKKFCQKKGLAVRYKDNPKDLTVDDFWKPIKEYTIRDDHGTLVPFVDEEQIERFERGLRLVLNPLSHSRDADTYRQEVEEAIQTVTDLKRRLT